jgi:hypothetical protein
LLSIAPLSTVNAQKLWVRTGSRSRDPHLMRKSAWTMVTYFIFSLYPLCCCWSEEGMVEDGGGLPSFYSRLQLPEYVLYVEMLCFLSISDFCILWAIKLWWILNASINKEIVYVPSINYVRYIYFRSLC